MAHLDPAPDGYPIKIVRDKTASIINHSGTPGALWYGATPEIDKVAWLKKKLIEESAEFAVDGGWAELCDVYAVVIGLAWQLGGSTAALELALKDDDRGGFFDCVMMYGRHDEFDLAQARVKSDG